MNEIPVNLPLPRDVQLHPCGIILPEKEMSVEDIHAVWRKIISSVLFINSTAPFWLGDLLNYAETKDGKKVLEMMEEAIADVQESDRRRLLIRLRRYKWVTKNIPLSVREEIYRETGVWPIYSMCRAAIRLGDQKAIKDAIIYGIQQGMTVREFSRYVLSLLPEPERPAAKRHPSVVEFDEEGRPVVSSEVETVLSPTTRALISSRAAFYSILETIEFIKKHWEEREKCRIALDAIKAICENGIKAIRPAMLEEEADGS